MKDAPVIDSATCALVPSWRDREVFLAHRVAGHRSFPDQWVFPGGRVEEADRRAEVEGLSGEDAAFHACAVREVFEETGVLLARPVRPDADLASLRREVVAGRLDLERVLGAAGARLAASDLAHLGTKTTPPFAPLRFRNRFCMAELPPGQRPEVWPGELDRGRWLRVEEALDLWARMELRLVPPVLLLLEGWGEGDAAAARGRLSGFDDAHFERRLPRVRFAPGVVVASLRTPTLPPATTTNTCIVGEERLYVVDPATPHEDQQALLVALVEEMRSEGRRVEAVVLTHEHHDHVAAAGVVARRFGVAVLAHPLTLVRLGPLSGVQTRPLEGGGRLPLGPGWELEAVHTPGHAPGHLVLHEGRYGSLVAGDMVSTVSTIIIDPDLGGDMAAYMESLARLRALGARTLYPAHGPPVTAVARVLDDYVAHRQGRERAFLASLAAGPRRLEEVLPEVYADVPPEVHPLAMKSLRALAAQCLSEGSAQADGDGRYRTP